MTTHLIASKNTNLLPEVLEARIQNKPLRLKEFLGRVPSRAQRWGESISLSWPVDTSCLHSIWPTPSCKYAMSFSTSVPSFLSSLVTYAKFLLPYKAMYTVVLGIRVWTSLGHALQPSIPFNFILHNKLCNSCVALLCLWIYRSSWAQMAMTIHCLNAQEKGPGTWGSHKISNHGQLSLSRHMCRD